MSVLIRNLYIVYDVLVDLKILSIAADSSILVLYGVNNKLVRWKYFFSWVVEDKRQVIYRILDNMYDSNGNFQPISIISSTSWRFISEIYLKKP